MQWSQEFLDRKMRDHRKLQQRMEEEATAEIVREVLKASAEAKNFCELHPHSGRTQSGSCWGCYADKYESACRPALAPLNKARMRHAHQSVIEGASAAQ